MDTRKIKCKIWQLAWLSSAFCDRHDSLLFKIRQSNTLARLRRIQNCPDLKLVWCECLHAQTSMYVLFFFYNETIRVTVRLGNAIVLRVFSCNRGKIIFYVSDVDHYCFGDMKHPYLVIKSVPEMKKKKTNNLLKPSPFSSFSMRVAAVRQKCFCLHLILPFFSPR